MLIVMKRVLLICCLLVLGFVMTSIPTVRAAIPDQEKSGSVGLQGTISSGPPTRGATISVPGNGAVFTTVPITVSGICPAGTVVKIFSNNVFMGSAFCNGGSYSVQISLFSGKNDLVARVYDALDQAGPDSNIASVTFNDASYAQFGTHVMLTSVYAQRGSPPNEELNWPVILSGGIGPYAMSVDWGDGSPTDLTSQSITGTIDLKHIYKSPGIYKVIVKVTDKNGGTAFLQLVAQATGAGQDKVKDGKGDDKSLVKVQVIWWPAILMFPLIVAAFWVGRRHELYTLRKQLEKNRAGKV